MKLLWPHAQFRFSEDAALNHLVSHGYDIEWALAQLVVDVDAIATVLLERDRHLEKILRGNVKPDKDIEHTFFSTRKWRSDNLRDKNLK